MAKFKIQSTQTFNSRQDAEVELEDNYGVGHEVIEELEQPTLESIPDKNDRTIQAITFVLVVLIFVGQTAFFFMYLSLLSYKP